MGFSKKLTKIEDDGKLFAQKSLAGDASSAMDIDQIMDIDGSTSIIEFAKCENKYLTTWESHPRNYPWNWRKYVKLSQYARKLGGYLYVVNYSTGMGEERDNKVRVLKVDGYFPEEINKWNTLANKDFNQAKKTKCDYLNIIEDKKITFSQFSQWLREQNQNNLKKDVKY